MGPQGAVLSIGLRQQLPDMSAIPGVEQVEQSPSDCLQSVFLDTDALALSAAGISLCLRTSSGASSWHLTLPDGTVLRVLVEFPDPATVPAPMRERLPHEVSPAALKARVIVTELRSPSLLRAGDGHVRATLFDDLVSARDVGSGAQYIARRTVYIQTAESEDPGDAAAGSAALELLLAAGARRIERALRLMAEAPVAF